MGLLKVDHEDFMKKSAIIVILAVTLSFLCSCSNKETAEHLEFPETVWGMSMDEILDAYGVTYDETTSRNESEKAPGFAIEGQELFGQRTSKMIFNFIDLKDDGTYGLCGVKVIYPETAAMESVLDEMQEMYGETVLKLRIYDLYQVMEESITEIKYEDSEHVKLWADTLIADVIPGGEVENYKNLWKDYQPRLNDDNWETFSQNANLVTVVWSNEDGMNMLSFHAYNLLVYEQVKSQLSQVK